MVIATQIYKSIPEKLFSPVEIKESSNSLEQVIFNTTSFSTTDEFLSITTYPKESELFAANFQEVEKKNPPVKIDIQLINEYLDTEVLTAEQEKELYSQYKQLEATSAEKLGFESENPTREKAKLRTAMIRKLGLDLSLIPGERITDYKFTDGDTFQIEITDGVTQRFRLVGVNTPERVSSKDMSAEGKKKRQKYNYVNETIKGLMVLEKDSDGETVKRKPIRVVIPNFRDRNGNFGRPLVFVYVEDEAGREVFLNEYILKNGLGTIYNSDISEERMEAFRSTQSLAIKQKIGIWAE